MGAQGLNIYIQLSYVNSYKQACGKMSRAANLAGCDVHTCYSSAQREEAEAEEFQTASHISLV